MEEAGFLSGSATALEIHLSAAGRLAPQAALTDIRSATEVCADCSRPSRPRWRHRRHRESGPRIRRPVDDSREFRVGLAALLVAAGGIALAAFRRSPVQGVASVGLTMSVAVVAVAIATVAGIPLNAASLLLVLPVLFAVLPMTTGLFTGGDSGRWDIVRTAAVLAISLLPLAAAATLAVRGLAVVMTASMVLIALGWTLHPVRAFTAPLRRGRPGAGRRHQPVARRSGPPH